MESANNIFEDDSTPEEEKLKRISSLLDTKFDGDKETINTDGVFDIATEDTNLKYDVLRRIIASKNFGEHIEEFINYFKQALNNLKNYNLLVKILGLIFEIGEDGDRIQHILNQVGIANVNKVLLLNVLLENGYEESNLVSKAYLKYLSIDQQAAFFNDAYELSEIHQNVKVMHLALRNFDTAALIDNKSVLRTENFWLYLISCLVKSNERQDTETVISVLQFCINLVKNEKLELNFTDADGAEASWKAFFDLIQVFGYYEKIELIKASLLLLPDISSLHYFWQHCVYELLLTRVPSDVKCRVLVSILKQIINDENLNSFFKLVFSAIQERNCDNGECPVFTELNNFCESTNVENLQTILDELLIISWSEQLVWKIIGNVLVDSKRNLVAFEYLSRIIRRLETCDLGSFPCLEMDQISKFFFDPENIDFWKEIRGSRIPFSTYIFPISEKFKNMAIQKLIELSNENLDDLLEINIYLGFLRDSITHPDIIKNYPVGIHVRLVIYQQLFNMNGYYTAERELDQENTVDDFYKYLLKHLNENTYLAYQGLMVYFLELNGRFMGFLYPEKACAEFLKIILNPEEYTKYQLCCTTDILRRVYYRFPALNDSFYNKIAQKWKYLIVETDDPQICKGGLYFVLEKGQLGREEYNEIVKNILEKHFCDDAADEIYKKYLNADLLNYAYKRLMDIKENSTQKYEAFSKHFCQAAVSPQLISSDKFSYENDEYKFCFSNSNNLVYCVREVGNILFYSSRYDGCREKIIDLILEIFLNQFGNMETTVNCLHSMMRIVSADSHDRSYPSPHDRSYLPPLLRFKEAVKRIMNIFQEKYVVYLENEVNKLRIVQGLFLLIPYVIGDLTNKTNNEQNRYSVKQIRAKIYNRLRNNLKRIAVGILVKEAERSNTAVRQICQHMYILLCQRDVTFKEVKTVVEKLQAQPNLISSFVPVLYHVMQFCKFTEKENEEIFESMFYLLLTSDEKQKIYAQILLQHICLVYEKTKFKNTVLKYKSRLEQNNLEIGSNKSQIVELLNTDYIFLTVFDPIRDHSLETLLCILPKLNQVDSSEWEGIMKRHLIWDSKISYFTIKNDEKETLKKAVEVDSCEWKGVMKPDLLWNSRIKKFTVDKDKNEELKKLLKSFYIPRAHERKRSKRNSSSGK